MRTTTLNILSASIRSKSLSLLFLLFSFNYCKAGNGDGNESDHIQPIAKTILNTSFYTSLNQQTLFSDTSNYFVVLKNNKSCLDCFVGINNFVKILKDSVHASFLVVSLTDSSTLDRKRNYKMTKELMPDFDDFLFQYRGSSQNNIFDILHTEHTPELLILHSGRVIRIPYDGIFDYPSLNISFDAQITIFEALKK